MAVQIGSPFKAAFPYNGDTGYVAEAAEIRDMEWNGTSGAGAKQSQINQEFKSELESVQLTTDELDAIVNEVDMTGKYIEFTVSGNTVRAYRKSAFDVAKTGYNLICFCKVDGTKYFIRYTGTWSDSSSTIDTGTNVYDSTDTSAVATVTGGTEGFVVEGRYVTFEHNSSYYSEWGGDFTFLFYVPSEVAREYVVFGQGDTKKIAVSLVNGSPTTSSSVKAFFGTQENAPSTFEYVSGGVIGDLTAVHGF